MERAATALECSHDLAYSTIHDRLKFRNVCAKWSLFRTKRLCTNIEMTLHRALVRRIMTYAYPACTCAADNHILKLERLQKKVLHTIGNFPRFTPVRDLHVAFKLLYIYDCLTKLCRQQAEIIQNHENAIVLNIGQDEPRHRK
ncbi:hypothetical protein B7P43_G01555 [Cryptotermes secundus]|uniref:Uncharacterized protein n=1 Tax=Cryptotermes secundus TaxID=105785 RepID=A0A2J7PFA0_9NEOP|nr:hypothetical protein B7P43_G01555 [Cryptotermes secundus]